MSNFTEKVKFESTDNFVSGRRVYRLMRSLTWEVGFKGSGETIIVPKDFQTDFLSVPPLVKPWVDSDGPYCAAGALHDYLYHTQYVSRKFADLQFLEALIALGCKRWVARILWATVRAAGWQFYGKDTLKTLVDK